MITDVVSGEVVCGSCGLVLVERNEDYRAEFSASNIEGFYTMGRSGLGSSLAIHDKGLATNIGSDWDVSGNRLPSSTRHTFGRLRKWDSRIKSTSQSRTLMKGFSLLSSMKTKLAIPDAVIEKTAYIFRKAMHDNMTKQRGIDVTLCATLYAACREFNIPRTLKDIASAGNIKRKSLARVYRILIRHQDLRQSMSDSSEFVTRISSEVGVSEKTRRCALNLLFQATEKEISAGKNPVGLAASALYLSSIINDEKIKQSSLARVAGISAVSIRNRVTDLKKELRII